MMSWYRVHCLRLVLFVPCAALLGCAVADGRKSVGEGNDKGKTLRVESVEWGPLSRGVQVSLEIKQKVWKEAESPSLVAKVRNTGGEEWNIYQTQEMWTLELDDVRYVWGGATDAKSSWLPPDRRYDGIAFTLTDSWQRAQGRTPLQLAPGRHTARVLCPMFSTSGRGTSSPVMEATSNRVEFEIAPK